MARWFKRAVKKVQPTTDKALDWWMGYLQERFDGNSHQPKSSLRTGGTSARTCGDTDSALRRYRRTPHQAAKEASVAAGWVQRWVAVVPSRRQAPCLGPLRGPRVT